MEKRGLRSMICPHCGSEMVYIGAIEEDISIPHYYLPIFKHSNTGYICPNCGCVKYI